MPDLLDDTSLERSAVVANNAMNRERGLAGVNSYARELGFDPYERLAERLRHDPTAEVTWIDVCCGSGRALLEAESRFAREFPDAEVALIGVDLVDFFAARPRTPRLRLVAASALTWTPDRPADLVTCVHGLHYLGDKLAMIRAMAEWTAASGLLCADLDLDEIRGVVPATVLAELRAAGLAYDRRAHRLRGVGPRVPHFSATYLGADDTEGPGYTGQPSVRSYYR
ncbi:class I SAM-dependent methyltransferase [Nocardia neocaledoniensis]|uniref:class I SAM-dependent methyltransferase n=1 Tax=Nocardia neocaledoniensis TaxID=236511 RepID=UPI0024556571|nr:class I SAM-dependent methyltransferase [Nocardia neocaledoniensis]